MDTLTPPLLAPFFEAQSLSALIAALGDAVNSLLGGGRAGEVSLLVVDEELSADGWVINATALHKRRQFRSYTLEANFLQTLHGAPHLLRLGVAPAQLLRLKDALATPFGLEAQECLVAPIGGEGCRTGALIVGLARPGLGLDAAQQDGLLQIAATLGRVASRLLQFERAECQSQQLLHLYEGLLRVMTAPDKNSLLAGILAILNRQFGMSRIIIAQLHPETQTLRSELHSGYKASFTPFTIPLENCANLLVRTMTRGDVLVFESEGEPPPEGLPPFIGTCPAERRLLLPLRVGVKPIGLIYADQEQHDGQPLFKNVLEIFARMAAAAMESLALRIRAEQRAETDALTGLYNRYFLDKVLEIEIPRVKRYNHPISLLMIDLCDFKRVNDTYGHQFGDYILRETAGLIEANVRRPDIVVRYGGDEFVVLMVNTTAEQACLVRNRIEGAFIERNRLQTDERMTIKISMGLRSADAATIEGLLHEADMEMYAHKARQTRGKLIAALIAGNPEKIEQADRVVGSLCNILYKKAPYYAEHARRVAHMTLKIARRLGLPFEEVATLVLAALLHDVGKVSIPTEILQKIDPLTPSEIEAMRHHPSLGQEFFEGLDHLEPVRPIIQSHHERYDGRTHGEFPAYPEGLCGERIPLGARILKLAESADCMLSGRPYRAGKPPEEVTRILREEAGASFDPLLVNILLADKDWYEHLSDVDRMSELLHLEE